MKIQQLAKAIRASGIKAKVGATGEAPRIDLDYGGLHSEIIFAGGPHLPEGDFDGIIFQLFIPHQGELTEVEMDEFNSSNPTIKAYLVSGAARFGATYFIPSELMNGDLFKRLLLTWVSGVDDIVEWFSPE